MSATLVRAARMAALVSPLLIASAFAGSQNVQPAVQPMTTGTWTWHEINAGQGRFMTPMYTPADRPTYTLSPVLIDHRNDGYANFTGQTGRWIETGQGRTFVPAPARTD